MGNASSLFWFTVDDEDIEKVKKYLWFKSKNGYVVANISHKYNPKGGTIYLHRLIMGVSDGSVVDHIDHNKLNNSKCNLRICTYSQNTCNSRLRKDSRTGQKGVGFCKVRNSFRARIMINKKDIHLGYFSNIKEAVEARIKAEIDFHKEFRYKP